MSKDRNTYAKRAREVEKKRKAEEKRERRRKKKQQLAESLDADSAEAPAEEES